MKRKNDEQIFYQVIEYFIQEIKAGNLSKGDKIPTERHLVEILGIGRNSIREALKILDIVGILDRKQGDGTYIRKEFDNWFSEPMSIAVMLSDMSKNEVFEFRNMIEVEIATLAADRITDAEIEDLKACYEIMIGVDDEVINAKYDKKFHRILAKASQNIIIINSYNAMDYLLDLFIYDIRKVAFNNMGKELVINVHKDILEAISNRNSKDAREAMKKHMDIIKTYYR